jgi:NADH:ubiquinone oxidoreductase subunit 4 (subunit M)
MTRPYALLLLALPQRAKLAIRFVSLAGALIPCGTSLLLLACYDASLGGFQFTSTVPLVPELGLSWHMGVDGISVPLVLLTALIHLTSVFTSWTLKEREKEFFLFVALLVTGVYGVFISLDLFLFFLFYELAVLPMYVLIGIWGSSMDIPGQGPFRALFSKVGVGLKEYGAMKLTLYLLAGSAFILAGSCCCGSKGAGSWAQDVSITSPFRRRRFRASSAERCSSSSTSASGCSPASGRSTRGRRTATRLRRGPRCSTRACS